MTVKEVLEKEMKRLKENNIENPGLQARIILAFILNISKEKIFCIDNQELEKEKINEYEEKIDLIKMGYPIQYITGRQEFMGMDFFVNENVLIPRADTEILVEEVIYILKKNFKGKKSNILDLCSGSGAIGISIAKYIENIEVILADISKKAIEVSKINAKNNKIQDKVQFIVTDLFEKIKNVKFDIIVSNPPYIETNTISTLDENVKKEPPIALDGGEDGLYFYRRIIKESKKFLNKGGFLCLEIGYNQKSKIMKLLEQDGFRNIYSKKDLNGKDRIVVGND